MSTSILSNASNEPSSCYCNTSSQHHFSQYSSQKLEIIQQLRLLSQNIADNLSYLNSLPSNREPVSDVDSIQWNWHGIQERNGASFLDSFCGSQRAAASNAYKRIKHMASLYFQKCQMESPDTIRAGCQSSGTPGTPSGGDSPSWSEGDTGVVPTTSRTPSSPRSTNHDSNESKTSKRQAAMHLIWDSILQQSTQQPGKRFLTIWKLHNTTKTSSSPNWRKRKLSFQRRNSTDGKSTKASPLNRNSSSHTELRFSPQDRNKIVEQNPSPLVRSHSHGGWSSPLNTGKYSSSPKSPLTIQTTSSRKQSASRPKSFRIVSSIDVGAFSEDSAYICLQIHFTTTAKVPFPNPPASENQKSSTTKNQPLQSPTLNVSIHTWTGSYCSKSSCAKVQSTGQKLQEYFSYFVQPTLQNQNIELQINLYEESSHEESPLFRSYFKFFFYQRPNHKIENGCMGFVRDGRLIQVKGYLSNMSVKEVDIRMDSLNHGDVFIWEKPPADTIYIWAGKESNYMEQDAAGKIAQHLQNVSKGKKRILLVDTQTEKDFLSMFPSHTGSIRSAADGGDDVEALPVPHVLYRIENVHSNSSREMLSANNTRFTFVARGKLFRNMLSDDKAAYLLDTGLNLLLWLGSRAPLSVRRESLKFALHYIREFDLSPKTCVSYIFPNEGVQESNEIRFFKEQFVHWGS